jgi:hypothetical protein
MVSESFSDFIKSWSFSDIASEILDEANRDRESILVDFKMSKGRMSGVGEFNTLIRFDLGRSPKLKEILKRMIESENPTQEDVLAFEEWRKEVALFMIEQKSSELKESICKSAFSGNMDIPFKIVSADFELTDLPSNDKVVVVKKASPPGVMMPPVSGEIMRIHSETGEDFATIINRKKAQGDPKYHWIVGVDSHKSFYEVTLSIAVDYSVEEVKGKEEISA